MKRVNLELRIKVVLKDAETGKVEPVPFDGKMRFNYRNVSYPDGLDIQESFARSVSEHGDRMFAKGRQHAANLASETDTTAK